MSTPNDSITPDPPGKATDRSAPVPSQEKMNLAVRVGEGEQGRIVLGLLVGLLFGSCCVIADSFCGGSLMLLWMFAMGWAVGRTMRLSVRKVSWELGLVTWQYGLSAIGVTLILCLLLDVCLGWLILIQQSEMSKGLPRGALSFFSAFWQYGHLVAYGLAAAASYLNCYNYLPWKPAPTPNTAFRTRRTPQMQRLVVLLRLGPPLLTLLGFLVALPLSIYRTTIHELVLSPDGQSLAVVQDTVVVHELRSEQVLRLSSQNARHIAWTADSWQIAYVRNVASFNHQKGYAELAFLAPWVPGSTQSWIQPQQEFTCLASTPSSELLAIGCDNGEIFLLDRLSRSLHGRLTNGASVRSIAISRTRPIVAAGLEDGQIVLWEPGGQAIRAWQAHSLEVHTLRFHPHSDMLFSASMRDGEARAWEPASGNEIRSYPLDADWITGLALSADGQTLAVFGGSFHHPGQVRVMDVADGRERFLLTVPSNTVSTAAFSADGRMLFAGTRPPLNPLTKPRNGQVYRWNVATGMELPPLQERQGRVR